MKTDGMYRLTLTAEAFALALQYAENFAGKAAFLRPDGKWDVAVTTAAMKTLQAYAAPKENFSDTVVRIYKGEGK